MRRLAGELAHVQSVDNMILWRTVCFVLFVVRCFCLLFVVFKSVARREGFLYR